MTTTLPKPNTYEDVAKKQHLIPRTYMRMWSPNNNDSILIFDKKEPQKGLQPKNVDNINYKIGFHDIKAGDLFIPDNALSDLFGFLSAYSIFFNNTKLSTLRELSDNYIDFDNWKIYNSSGTLINKKEKNEIKRIIAQSRHPFIESQWSVQLENDWQRNIKHIESKIRCKVYNNNVSPLNHSELKMLFTYLIIFDFRKNNGNAWISHIIDTILPIEYSKISIPVNERMHNFINTLGEELKHFDKVKAYYEFLNNKTGHIATMIDNYVNYFGITVLLTAPEFPFITSESPSIIINRIDKLKEHLFVATPTMLISTYKKKASEPNLIRSYLRPKDVWRYNKYIAKHSEVIISKDKDLNCHRLLAR